MFSIGLSFPRGTFRNATVPGARDLGTQADKTAPSGGARVPDPPPQSPVTRQKRSLPYVMRRDRQRFREGPECPPPLPRRGSDKPLAPRHRAPDSSPLPSFLVKAFNKDFIFPLTLAAVGSLYNLLRREEGKGGCPAPRRCGGVDPGSGGGRRLGAARFRARRGMRAPARWRQSPPHILSVSWEPTVRSLGLLSNPAAAAGARHVSSSTLLL